MGQLVVLSYFVLIGGIIAAKEVPDVLPPSIEEMGPKEIIFRFGDLVTIPCRASGIPTPVYEWTLNGHPLNLGGGNIKMSSMDGMLSINPVTSLDEGYYQCRAKNQYGQDISGFTSLRRAVLGRFPPRAPKLYTGKEGEPLELPCEGIKSFPPPKFSWNLRKDLYDENPAAVALDERIQMDENGNLHFAYLTRNDTKDGQIYTCNVFNSFLDITTGGSFSTIQVNPGSLVNREPSRMYTTPRKVIALRGQDEVRFKCFFSGIPAPTIFWARVGGALPAGRYALEASNTELVIQNVQEADEGLYQCIASNTVGTIPPTTFVLHVQSKPVFFPGLRPTNTNATEKGQAEFNCKVEAEPPATVTWYIDGGPIDTLNPGPRRKISEDGTRFTVSNLCRDCPDGQSDVMVVQCNASNIHGYTFASGYLNVIPATTTTVNKKVRRPPVIEEMGPKEIIYESDDTVTIPCRASGIPPPTYRWMRNGRPLNLQAGFVKMSSKDWRLTIDPVTSLDEGYYQCIAQNQYGQDLSSLTLLKRAFLARFYHRRAILPKLQEGQSFRLECDRFKSFPPPKFSWVLSKGLYDENPTPVALNERIQMDAEGNLYFAYVTGADSMEGQIYTCNALNSYIDITIGGSFYKISVKPGSLANREPSLMYNTPRQVIAIRGQDEVRFKCFFSGIPAPAISWTRVGGALPAGRFALEASNTELVIQNVREADEGFYQCTASNSVGTSAVKFTLDVQSKPEFVKGLRPTSIDAPEEGQAEFNCKVEAEPPATITWYINGEAVDNLNPGPRRTFSEDGTRFTISNLDGQSDEMVVQCNASNVHGYQFASGYLNVISL